MTAHGSTTVHWTRTDKHGLERLELTVEGETVTAAGTVLALADGGFRLDHRWSLDQDWSVQSVELECWGRGGRHSLGLTRIPGGWTVDGRHRPDLDGAEEPDLSATPFCNSFAIRRLPQTSNAQLTLDVVFIEGSTLAVSRSRQSYRRMGPRQVRYRDLGLFEGFEADLVLDDLGLVVSYEHLFRRLDPSPAEG